MSEKKRKCIFVIGMHRSGTSAMAGALHQLGITIGKDIMAPNEYNEKGYFENNKVYRLNDEIFEFLGVNWHTTYLLEENWYERQDLGHFKERIVQILDEEFANEDLFLIKDPRISILAPIWIEVFDGLGIEMKWIMMLRHPFEIGESLKRRESFTAFKTSLIWRDHVLRTLLHFKHLDGKLIEFDQLIDDPDSTLREIIAQFDLDAPASSKFNAAFDFVDRRLRHIRLTDSKLDSFPKISEIWTDIGKGLLKSKNGYYLEDHLRQLRYDLKLGKLFSSELFEEQRKEIEDRFLDLRNTEKSEHFKTVRTLEKSIEDAKLKIRLLKEDITTGKRRQDEMTGRLEVLSEELKLSKVKILEQESKNREEIETIKAENSELEKSKEQAERRISQLDNALQNSENEAQKLKNKLHHLVTRLKSVSINLESEVYEKSAIKNSLTFKIGHAILFPFISIYRLFFNDAPIAETRLWILTRLFFSVVEKPIQFIKRFRLEKIRVLMNAMGSESSETITTNLKNFLENRSDAEIVASQRDNVVQVDYIRVLFVSPNLPDYDESSGGKRATAILSLLAEEFDVYAFTPGRRPAKYVENLEAHNITVIETSSVDRIPDYLNQVDVIIFAWYSSYYRCQNLLELFPLAKVIADTVDVHWIREQRSIGTSERYTEENVSANMKREIAFYRIADLIWVVTEKDRHAILDKIPSAETAIVSNIHTIPDQISNSKKESNVLFFGGYQHHPNLYAVKVLALEIMPLIVDKVPSAKLIVAGSKAPEEVQQLGDLPYVEFLGFVEDEDIEDLYARSLLTIVPLNSGAGIKGKICEAIAHDTLVITNEIGNEGINLINGLEGFITEDVVEMAEYGVQVLSNDIDRRQIALNARDKIKKLVGPEVARKTIRQSISPKVMICIVTYNQRRLLEDCLHSIFENTVYPNYQVAVYSNACSDGTKELLEKLSRSESRLITFYSQENEVFVRPNNKMMRKFSNCDIVLLNNDTQVEKGWLMGLWRAAYSSKEIGISGSKLLYPNGVLQEFGSELYSTGKGKNLGKNDDANKPEYQGIKEVGYVSGCSMYIKRSTINRIGIFDDQFHPCYCEDSDYCYTGWENGIKTVVTSDSVIFHYEGSTSGTDTSVGFKKYQRINMEKFLNKHKDSVDKLNSQIWTRNHERSAEKSVILKSEESKYLSFVFTHIPKCGGTSFRRFINDLAISSGINEDQIYIPGLNGLENTKNLLTLDQIELDRVRGRNIRVLADHTLYKGIDQLSIKMANPFYYTILRDPIERFISHYNFFCKKLGNRGLRGVSLNEIGEEKLVEVLSNFSNLQIRYLTNYRSGEVNKSTLLDAIFILESKFPCFGLLEDMETSLALFNQLKPDWLHGDVFFPILNKNKTDERLSTEIIERIQESNSLETELYNRAVDIFQKRCECLNAKKKNEDSFIKYD